MGLVWCSDVILSLVGVLLGFVWWRCLCGSCRSFGLFFGFCCVVVFVLFCVRFGWFILLGFCFGFIGFVSFFGYLLLWFFVLCVFFALVCIYLVLGVCWGLVGWCGLVVGVCMVRFVGLVGGFFLAYRLWVVGVLVGMLVVVMLGGFLGFFFFFVFLGLWGFWLCCWCLVVVVWFLVMLWVVR